MRRETPDSEALASSEDERPWPSAPSFGTLPRKENGVPGLGGGIWSQKRGSFKMEHAAQRNAAREARFVAPTQVRSGLRAEGTPSPAPSEGSGALPFAIPLQPTPKLGRSASHSQGQREVPLALGAHSSSNEHAVALPLGLLAEEEVDTETESELGGALTHTTSHPPIGTLHRTSTYPSTYESYYGGHSSKMPGEATGGAQQGAKGDSKFEGSFANLSLDHPQRRSNWQSHLGWEDLPNANESRRHSLADIPTRRGSLTGTDHNSAMGGGAFWPDRYMYDWEGGPHSHTEQAYRDAQQQLEFGTVVTGRNGIQDTLERQATMKPTDLDENGDSIEIPTMYKVPFIKLQQHERSEQSQRGQPASMHGFGPYGGNSTRARKHLFIVSFKCSRVDVFYLLDNTGLFIKEGDIVIVEADRGQDLGTVQHASVTPDEARLYKRKYGEEQYKWLMMFSKNNQQGNVNPNAQVYGENNANGGGGRARSELLANAPATMQGLPRDNFNNLKPKAIKRLASSHEIRMLAEKEGNEAKAKRTCQHKVQHLNLDMEILDAEWQWDFQKLIFYYYADHYINFKDLITELYRIYKTRIWLSAINPASFSQHALGQPPSGIGPGAIGGMNNDQIGNAYTMSYGPDPDPYGAVPPYRIGYDTYTPNFPAIPGVANSFAPMGVPNIGGYNHGYDGGSGDATPSMPPGVTPTGSMSDYNYFYGNRGLEIRSANPKAAVGPQHLFPASDASYQPPFQPYGSSNPLSMTGNPPAPFGSTPFASSASPASNIASVGRAAPSLGPIGTRPPSNGNTLSTSASRTMPPIPGLSMPGMTGPRGASQMSAATASFNPWSPSVSAGESGGMLDRYLDSLTKKSAKDSHADEMSRER